MVRLKALTIGWILLGAHADTGMSSEPEGAPSRYVLDYPAADRFCPPIRSTFAEVTQTFLVVRGHRFSQRPNGGYGVAMGQKIGKKHLLHVGADLGWFQDGEPVYAVANGVVRIGQGVLPADRHERDQEKPTRAPLMWGNLIVVEHRLPDHGDFFFTVYGHLGTDRLVRVGDIVQAGQPIGTIGRRKVNGGYSPHLHFGVGRGRLAEEGMTLFSLHLDDKAAPVTLAALGEEQIRIDAPNPVPERLQIDGTEYPITRRDDQYFLPSHLLHKLTHRPIVGYDLSTEGWYDPIAFLVQHGAHAAPAPFLPLGGKR